jgi:ceramide glucosyltransferase
MLETCLVLLVVISWLYWFVAWWTARSFFRSRSRTNPDFTPPVSMLKPVKGMDHQAYQNFVSFCRQDYPSFELLFGVADPDDPVVSIVERLRQEFPEQDIRLVTGPAIGSNRKVSLLHHLAAQAKHEVLVISDSDMRVTPDFLRRVVAPLADEQIGLVHCPYRGGFLHSLAAQFEALHMGVAFVPSALIASQLLKLPFALGAIMVLRQRDLARMGGFAAIADHLADDHELGARIGGLGLRVHLSDYVVTSILGAISWSELWHQELRWSRCNWVSNPWGTLGLFLSFSTPLALVLLLISGFSATGWQALAISLLLRWLMAWRMTRYTCSPETRQALFWLPIRDVLGALLWGAGGLGHHIVWRDEKFVLRAGGRMEPVPSAAPREQKSFAGRTKSGPPTASHRLTRTLRTWSVRFVHRVKP